MITIIMPTYKRNEFLSDKSHPTLNLTNHPLIDKLLIIWQNIDEKVPVNILNNIKKLGIEEKVIFKYPTQNSLNNRFYPYPEITKCILSIDDDYIMTPKALEKCYKIWSKKINYIVGVVPRFINEKDYSGNAAQIINNEPYNVILTGGALFHKKFLNFYSEDKNNLKLMNETFNGEDIMFNFVHNNYFPTSPIYVHDDNIGTWKKIKGNSIADRSGGTHRQKRHYIYKKMKEKYGDVLITTTKKHIL